MGGFHWGTGRILGNSNKRKGNVEGTKIHDTKYTEKDHNMKQNGTRKNREIKTKVRFIVWAVYPSPTWLAYTGKALPLILTYTVGRTRVGFTRVGHSTSCLNVHSAAGFGQCISHGCVT